MFVPAVMVPPLDHRRDIRERLPDANGIRSYADARQEAGIGVCRFSTVSGRGRPPPDLVKETTVSSSPHRPPHRRLPRPEPAPRTAVTGSPDTAKPPPPADGNQLLYTPGEAAEQLRVRESWLRRRAAARQIPCTFLGKHLRFSAADLAGIVSQNAQAPTGRRPRRRSSSTVRDRDLPTPRQRSVDPPDRDDHNHDDGSSPWHG